MSLLRSLALSLLLGVAPLTASAATTESRSSSWLDVELGQSFVYKDSRPIGRVLVSDDKVADIKLLEQGQFQVRGVTVGNTDLWVWYRDDMEHPVQFELTVHQDLSGLVRRIDDLIEGTPPRVHPMKDRLVLEGPVPDLQTLEDIAEMARVYDPEFVNLMSVTGDHQVQLEVVFAEVNRTGMRELGINGMWGDQNLGFGLQGPQPTGIALANQSSLSGIFNGDGYIPAPSPVTFQVLGRLGKDVNLTAILAVLEQNSLSKTLARPTLVAMSGQQAEFLAGGEVPIPVSQSGSRITIEFKEYGVKLVFVPTVLDGEVVDLRVYTEVSDIDSATSIRLTGVEIPGFLSRKTQSHLRIESGMTFAMAGMMHESMRATYAKVPVLGSIPVIGIPFRYVQHRRNESELIVLVTPRLVRPLAAGELPPLPGETENSNPTDVELFLLGMDHRIGSRTATPTGPVGLSR